MPLSLSSVAADPSAGELHALQERIHAMQGRRNRQGFFPVLPRFSGLFPGGIRGGAAYSLDVPLSVAMALLAGPSANGEWCGAAGIPDFGAEAAAGFGVDLERFVLVPDPGPDWLRVVSALADVLPVLLVRPGGRVTPGEAARLGSRLRERGGTLLVLGSWPQSEASLRVRDSRWEGLGEGHGHLRRHRVELELSRRGHVRTAAVDLGELDGPTPAGASRPLRTIPGGGRPALVEVPHES
ncbi:MULTISPECIES: hypothetical protein [Arthrobacter]|uniref:Protein ImuA n=2 Tax=Arthrobacter TaxID=1663 RepID=A0ABU9KMI5_9MICC|nr:hypothetical protein [Arthrobacter sp. YJM1]MDP5227961.1 hypothetical protein [Arthrobacter sp. YJM1]